MLAFVGAGAALFAEGFRAFLHAVYWLARRESVVDLLSRMPFAARVALVCAGCVAGAALAEVAKRRGEGGVNVISGAVVEGKGALSMRAALVRAFGALLAMGAGASIGREGPLVQFGAAFGQRVGERALDVSVRRRELVAAGTAAGFAAAYNAPIAGVLFVVEVMGAPARGSIARTGVACVAGAMAAHLVSPDRPLYGARTFALGGGSELLGATVVGLLGGLLGVVFVKLLRKVREVSRAHPDKRVVRALAGGLVAGIVIAVAPRVAGNGYDGILGLLLDANVSTVVLALLAAKLVATLGSVGSGAPGGVFTPSMFLGAALGILVHHAGISVMPSAFGDPGALAFVGMAALVAATTHAPLTATVLVIELSRSYALALPLLLATGLAMLVARRFEEASVYGVE